MNTRSKARLRLNYVYSALVASTAALAATPGGAQQVVADGVTMDIPANTVIDTGTTGGAAGVGIRALNGGIANAQGPVTIRTGGIAAHAVFVDAGGGHISLTNGGSITNTGTTAYGLWSAENGPSGSSIDAANFTIDTVATSVLVNQGGIISVVNTDMTSSAGFGLHAVGTGNPGDTTAIRATDVSIATGSAHAVESFGTSVVTLSTLNRAADTITAQAGEGILAQQGGTVQTTGGLVFSAAGADTAAVRALAGGQVRITGNGASTSKVETTGSNSSGLNANGAGSGVVASGLTVSTSKERARGAFATAGGTIALSDAVITTVGDDSRAMNATGAGSAVTASGVQASTQGLRAHGAYAQSGGRRRAGRQPRGDHRCQCAWPVRAVRRCRRDRHGGEYHDVRHGCPWRGRADGLEDNDQRRLDGLDQRQQRRRVDRRGGRCTGAARYRAVVQWRCGRQRHDLG